MNIVMNKRENASTLDGFESVGYNVGNMIDMFPIFSGIRVMMMPFFAHDVDGSVPDFLSKYKQLIKSMIKKSPDHVVFPENSTAYLTIDELEIVKNQIQRKSGLHVDGMYKGELAGAWGG